MIRLTRMIVALAAVLLMALAMPASAAADVPIRGTMVGEHGRVEGSPACPGADWQFFSSGTGTMSHLGRVDYELTQCTIFNPVEMTVQFSGTIVFTAANGDVLVVAQQGSSEVIGLPPAAFTYDATWQVVDGTGRFANANGSGTISGFGDVADGQADYSVPDGAFEMNFNGRISYKASDRSAR